MHRSVCKCAFGTGTGNLTQSDEHTHETRGQAFLLVWWRFLLFVLVILRVSISLVACLHRPLVLLVTLLRCTFHFFLSTKPPLFYLPLIGRKGKKRVAETRHNNQRNKTANLFDRRTFKTILIVLLSKRDFTMKRILFYSMLSVNLLFLYFLLDTS